METFKLDFSYNKDILVLNLNCVWTPVINWFMFIYLYLFIK